jgi:hypothetical protein
VNSICNAGFIDAVRDVASTVGSVGTYQNFLHACHVVAKLDVIGVRSQVLSVDVMKGTSSKGDEMRTAQESREDDLNYVKSKPY